MIWLSISFVAFAIAYILDAAMDTILFHWDSMIFPRSHYFRFDENYGSKGWKKVIPGRDAWHDFKKAKQFFIIVSAVAFSLSGVPWYFWAPALPLIIYVFHELFFHKVFERRAPWD